jgi:hypothetical protein
MQRQRLWQKRRSYSARSTLALMLSLVALVVAVTALVLVSSVVFKPASAVYPLHRYRAAVLPIFSDEPSAADLVGAQLPSADGTQTAEARNDPEQEHTGLASPWYGLCPKNRVVSLEDFSQIVLQDPRLRAYYGDFNWEKARLVTLAQPQLVYVSYQKHGAIARTRKKLRLPQGDTLITDGVITARTYCCNEIFEVVEAPSLHTAEAVSPPTPQSLLTTPPGGSPAILSPPAPGKVTGPPVASDPWSEDGLLPAADPPLPPVLTPVPAPATWQLVGIGLAVLACYRWWSRRHS